MQASHSIPHRKGDTETQVYNIKDEKKVGTKNNILMEQFENHVMHKK